MSMTERFGQLVVRWRTWRFVVMATELERASNLESPFAPEASEGPKRRQIVTGARRVFLAQGFDAASMGAIAREAGVSKGTLYVYFKNKEELFEAIVDEQCHLLAREISTFNEQADIETELKRFGAAWTRLLCRRPGGLSPLRTIIAI